MILPILLGFILVDRLGRWAGCGDVSGQYANSKTVSLKESDSPPQSRPVTKQPTEALRFVVAPVVSPKSSLQLYKLLSTYMAKVLGIPVELVISDSYAEVNALLRNNKCDFAFVCTAPFVVGERDFGLRAIAIPQIGGHHVYYSYIIVRKGLEAKTLLDLRNQRFASADVLSNSGWVYPRYWLTKRSVKVKTFFSRHTFSGSHDRSVLAVVNGEADAAAVDSIVYDHLVRTNPAVKERTRIIQKSPPFGMPPLVAAPGLDVALVQKIRVALLRADTDPQGREALQKLGFDRFVTPRREIYDSVREMSRHLGSTR